MARIRLAFVLHNHQPFGNFDSVFEDAYERAYEPFLSFLERKSAVRIALHNSGCLWEWLEAHRPDYGRRLEALVERGQVELLGGAFFEPILPLWPERDRRGQIRKMQEFLGRRFGVRPRGIWLAERVWEPHLTRDLAEEGIEYLFLDDTQFHQVGLEDDALDGHFLTEDSGRTVALFPIQMRLRYEIPFAEPETAVATIRAQASERDRSLRLFGDDGEKFGLWPGTDRLCYEDRWLDRFFDLLLAERETIGLILPSEHCDSASPRGRVHLPPGSYLEMGEWTLPLPARRLMEETKAFLETQGRASAARQCLRGGFFRNFLVHYEEANWMRSRVLFSLSELDRAVEIPAGAAAGIRDRLWRAQCNCAYWHGVFGGLYLPHLRHAIYREIVAAESSLERLRSGSRAPTRAERRDLDADGHEEILLASDREVLFIAPRRGGVVLEWDDRASARNLVNALTRRPEAYHDHLREEARTAERRGEDGAQTGEGGAGAVATIHGSIRSKEEGLERLLRYDALPRAFAADRFFVSPPRPEELPDLAEHDLARIAGEPYEIEELRADASAARLTLLRRVRLPAGGEIDLSKRFLLETGDDGFAIEYRLRGAGERPVEVFFGTELVVNLLAGHAHDRYVLVDGERASRPTLDAFDAHEGARRIALVDEPERMRVVVTAPEAAGFRRAPLMTVSLSEAGAEKIFQGTLLLPYWKIALSPGTEERFSLRASVERDETPAASAR